MLCVIGAVAGAPAGAQEPGWVTDSFSGCRSWDPYGSLFTSTSFIWVGGCEATDNIAAGPGVVIMTDSYGIAVVPQSPGRTTAISWPTTRMDQSPSNRLTTAIPDRDTKGNG
jgi:hypothetical protein